MGFYWDDWDQIDDSFLKILPKLIPIRSSIGIILD